MKKNERSAYNKYVQSLGTATNSLTRAMYKLINSGPTRAVDTGLMRNTARVKLWEDEGSGKVRFRIEAQFYYPYVDEGTRYIQPRGITKAFLLTEEYKKEMTRVNANYIKWIFWKGLGL